MVNYIAEKNNGTAQYRSSGGGCSPKKEWATVNINEIEKTYTIGEEDSIARIMNGNVIISSTVLADDFKLEIKQTIHDENDSFKTIDDAALAWALMYNSASQILGDELSSVIYGDKGSYKYTMPNFGDEYTVYVPRAPKGEFIRAVIHSHVYSPDTISEEFSDPDKEAVATAKVPIYLTTPEGYLKKYNPKNLVFKTSTVAKGLDTSWRK